MPEKDSEDSFYYLNAYQDDITPGQKMTILHNISDRKSTRLNSSH